MAVFTDSEHLYKVLIPFFNKLKDDPDIGPKVLASGLVIQFIYREPEGIVTIHCPDNLIIQGATEVKADVEMSMTADTAHKFWLGKVNLVMALTKRDITAKGPVAKILKLLPIIKNSYDMYKAYLAEIGMAEAAES